MVAGIKPCKASSKCLHLKGSTVQILVVDTGNLYLSSGRRLYILGNLNNIIVIEIKSRNGIVGLRILRLLLD